MSGALLIRDRRLYANIFALAFPIMLQQLLRVSVDTVNSILLGSIDQLQMSAVSQADQVFFIYYTVCNGLAVGCCVLVAQYWGRRDVESIRTVLATGLRTSAVFGIIATALVMAFPTLFMRLYSSDDALIALGAGYLRLAALTYLPCALSVMIFAGCRGVERVKVVLVTNIVSYSVNILLNYCLLYGRFGLPELGITGIAVGAVTARLVELAICGTYLLRMEKRIAFKPADLARRDRQLSRDILKVSGPIVAHEMIWSMGTSTGSMITGQLGTSVVAGYNVMMVLYNLCASVGNGYLNACSVVIAKTIGGGDREKVKRQAKTMLIVGLGIGLILGGVTLAARGPFLSLYNLEPDAVAYARLYGGDCRHMALLPAGDDRNDRHSPGRRRRKNRLLFRYRHHVDGLHPPGGSGGLCAGDPGGGGGGDYQDHNCPGGGCGDHPGPVHAVDPGSDPAPMRNSPPVKSGWRFG